MSLVRKNKNRTDDKFIQVENFLDVTKKLSIPAINGDIIEGNGTPIPIYYNTATNKLRVYIDNGFKDAVDLRDYYNKVELDALLVPIKTDVTNLKGLTLTADQAQQEFSLVDGIGTVLSTISVAFLNNEGTTFVYNDVTGKLELRNDQGELLSEIPVSSFVSNIAKNIRFNGGNANILELIDESNNVLGSVTFTIDNIQGLQAILNSKEPSFSLLPVSKGGTGLNSITADNFLLGGAANTFVQKTIAEVKTLLSIKNITDQNITAWDNNIFTAGVGLEKASGNLNVKVVNTSRITVAAGGIDLGISGIDAGTYNSVTVDVYGRVISGANIGILANYDLFLHSTLGDDSTGVIGNMSKPFKTMIHVLTVLGGLPLKEQIKARVLVLDDATYYINVPMGISQTIPLQYLTIIGLTSESFPEIFFNKYFGLAGVRFQNINITLNFSLLVNNSYFGFGYHQNIIDINNLKITGYEGTTTALRFAGAWSTFNIRTIMFHDYSYIECLGGVVTNCPVNIGTIINNSNILCVGKKNRVGLSQYTFITFNISAINNNSTANWSPIDFTTGLNVVLNIQYVTTTINSYLTILDLNGNTSAGKNVEINLTSRANYTNLQFIMGDTRGTNQFKISGSPKIIMHTLFESHIVINDLNRNVGSNYETLVLRNYNPEFSYSAASIQPMISISGTNYIGSLQASLTIDNCLFTTNTNNPLIGIAANVPAIYEELVVFKNHVSLISGGPLFVCSNVPTNKNYVIAKGANIDISSGVVEPNNRISIASNKTNYISSNIIPVTTNLTLTNLHNGATLVIDANVVITISANLVQYFSVDIDVLPTRQATFALDVGVTLTGNAGLILAADKMATLYMRSVGNNFRLKGETSAT